MPETRKSRSGNITGNTCFHRKQVVVNVATIRVFGCGNQTETNKLVRLRCIRKNGNTRRKHMLSTTETCKIHVNVMKTITETSIFALCWPYQCPGHVSTIDGMRTAGTILADLLDLPGRHDRFSKTFHEHLANLSLVLLRFRTAGIKLKPSKYHFGHTEVPYLGHIVSKDAVWPDQDKIRAVREFPVATYTKCAAFWALPITTGSLLRIFANLRPHYTN